MASLKEVATGKSSSPTTQLQVYFAQHKAQIEAALPKHLNADRMCRLALTSFHQNKSLMECDPKTVFASVVIAAQMGLEIGVAGQGYLVPYKGKCAFIPGWQGYVDLVSRAGRAVVWTGAVFDGDDFEYAMGDSPFIRHRPMGEDDPDKLIYTYAVGRVKGSEWPVIEVWPMKRLKAHFKRNNKVGGMHYANNHWEMYCRKIPLLQVIKYMPKSIELQNAMTVEAANEEGKGAFVDGDSIRVVDEETAPDMGREERAVKRDSAATTVGDGETTSLLDQVKSICAKAIETKDTEIAWLKLDEARGLIVEMLPENQALAQAEIDAAANDIKARFLAT